MAESTAGFDWHDGPRLVHFGSGRVGEAEDLVGGGGFTLLSTSRAVEEYPDIAGLAATVLHVPSGNVDEIARQLLDAGVSGDRLVALGGGRVIDTTKACAAARRARGESVRVVAIPTTLAGAEMTWIHRHASGVSEDTPHCRPDVVINDPQVSASQPVEALAASTLNSLGHAVEAPLTPWANPVATFSAHASARHLATGWRTDDPDRPQLALGSLLAGAAIDSAWYGLHHIASQTLVRVAGLSHGVANAVMLSSSMVALGERFPRELAELSSALGEEPADFIGRMRDVAGVTRLSELGVSRDVLPELADSVAGRDELAMTPPPASREEIVAIYERAW